MEHPTTLPLLANAYNSTQVARVAYPRATIESHPNLKVTYGDRLIAVEDVPAHEMRDAMRNFRARTDWSTWSREEWNAAYHSVGGEP